jgi:L-histidine N-alpha-methyltransferase
MIDTKHLARSDARVETLRGPSRVFAEAVAAGLASTSKSLPAWAFYDREGSELFEQITELPEYYPTRTERRIFRENADEIVATMAGDDPSPITVIELGAGTATKSQIILQAVVRRQGRCLYVPVDVSHAALDIAAARLRREEPMVTVKPLPLRNREATQRFHQLGGRRFVLFIGSSIGNFDEADAVELLRSVRRGLRSGEALLLGADAKKPLDVLLPAYDDASGATARFNKNVLARINRELGAEIDLDSFRHVALWNEERSRIEMHLESVRAQTVCVPALDSEFEFRRGERIHTESSHKYSTEQVSRLFRESGFALERSFHDEKRWFGVHVARALD